MLEAATQYLANRLTAITAVDVVYSRADDLGSESATVKATRGRTEFEGVDRDGIVQRTTGHDYLIATNVFPFCLPPANGDSITDGDNVYEVASMAGTQPYSYCDPGESLLRIHTKLLRRGC